MAALSRPAQQVFINFRGKELRDRFASHLIDALGRHSVKFFIDTHEEKGRDLKHLFKRIKESTVALVILSTRYGESKWCLEELRTIIEHVERGELVVIPIFYKVRPEEVTYQKGEFGNKFWRRTTRSSRQEMEKWQVALKAVSNKIGFLLEQNRVYLLTNNNNNVPLALPWVWFGPAVRLIVVVLLGLSLLANTVHKFASPAAMVALFGQAGVLMASSNCQSELSDCAKRFYFHASLCFCGSSF